MSMKSVFLGVDIGTFETKAVLVSAEGEVLASSSRGHKMLSPKFGWAEHDPEETWWGDFVFTVQELLASPKAQGAVVAAVACSAIGPCVLPVDRDLNPLRNGILYGVDTRSAPQIATLTERFGTEELFRKTGNELTTQSGGPKIMWLQENEPEVFDRAAWFLTAHSYIVSKLTGEITVDHATAGYYHPLYDVQTEQWDITGNEDYISLEQLPRIGWSTEIAGTVTAEAAAITGLPQGTPVTFGSADAPAEAVSAGVLADGDLMLMYGSSSFMIQLLETPVRDRVLWSAPHVFPGTSVFAGGTSTAGTLTHWMAELLGIGEASDPQARFAELMQLAEQAPLGSDGLLVLPSFSGERTPYHDPKAKGVIAGLTLNHGRAELVRALLEGIAFSIANALEAYDRVGQRPKSIKAVGGGTKNHILIQTVSDITRHSQTIADTAGAAYGDAALAALAIGHFSQRSEIAKWLKTRGEVVPNVSAHQKLAQAYEDFKQLYADNAALMHRQYDRGETNGS